MTSVESRKFAARLTAFAPGAGAMDALLTATGDKTDWLPKIVPTGPSLAVGRAVATKSVTSALLLAQSKATSPELLDVLAHQNRLTVRRAVAANPAAAENTLEFLASWALTKNDDETIDALLGTLPPSGYVPRMMCRRYTADDGVRILLPRERARRLDVAAIVDNLSRRADPGEVWATFRIAPVCLRRAIVSAAATGKIPVAAEELVHSTPFAERLPVIMAAFEAGNTDGAVFGDALCDMLLGHLESQVPHDQQPHPALPETYLAQLSRPTPMTQYCALRFLESGIPVLHQALCGEPKGDLTSGLALLPERKVDELVTLADEDTARAALDNCLDVLTTAQVDALARKCVNLSTPRRILKEFGKGLSADAIVAVLRAGNEEATIKWAVGGTPARPTVDVLERLSHNPGRSLRKDAPTTSTVGEYIDQVMRSLRPVHQRLMRQDVMCDLMNWAGPATLAAARTGDWTRLSMLHIAETDPARYVARRLTERFGDDRKSWQIAVDATEVLTVGTIDDWLNLVAALIS